MNILVIGNDPKIFEENSESYVRVRNYASLFGEFHIVSMARSGARHRVYDGNLFLWPVISPFLFFGWVRAYYTLCRIVKTHSITIIDAQDAGEAGLVAWLVSRVSKIPFRVQIHTDVMSPWFRCASWKEWVRYRIARFVIPRASCIRVVSERIKKSLLHATHYTLHAEKITVLPIFTDISKFLTVPLRNLKSGEPFTLVAIGRFVEKEKNFRMLIRMMRTFIVEAPGARLMIVGDGHGRQQYEKDIVRNGLTKHVILTQWAHDLVSIYSQADVVCVSSNYEGWGRVTIEAMASGVPVVTTDVGCAGEVVKNMQNGIVVPVDDEKAFYDACLRLYRNSELRRSLGDQARVSVMKLEPRTEEEYLKAYRDSFNRCLR